MTPDDPEPGAPLDDADLGPPVGELRDLSVVVGDRFGQRVRSKIERRLLAVEFVTLLLDASMTLLLEFLRVVFELVGSKRRT